MAGIYIHIPFCKQACFYCDFHFSTTMKHKTKLLDAIDKELVIRKSTFETEKIETIYFGGGTPSLLSVEEINKLIKTIEDNYNLADKIEITLEANPDDLSLSKIKSLAQTPINRLSIGVQSFYEEDLTLMNRAHNATEVKQALTDARQYFDNLTIDLIYGIPGMSSSRWEDNLEQALSYDIPHISSYALTVEPKTALEALINKGKIAPVEESLAYEHYQLLQAFTKAHNFINYEFSNFGKEGYFSKNNTAYWFGKPYIGVGPSAHSFYKNTRSWNVANNMLYIKALSENRIPSSAEKLSVTDLYNEYIMTRLRTMWGVSVNDIELLFGRKYVAYYQKITKELLSQHKLYIAENGNLVVKESAKFLTDGIASDLFYIS
ncbi:oxygen-independent coproporphyrinogen-3 oxidase [Mesonia hippocampi]|uniref:Heme chaperone HemW n=1 Tax=Mesonia hippocampi TaxID=1628250 RepID=A0A840EYR8_9FLAO|nr:radical SAM family heme chaperone HemW [Mesonia hippocampi]MBB4119957.1 oxygen-independent coproporphyrinogen-3 oxidase [Mesonia hippocampi]